LFHKPGMLKHKLKQEGRRKRGNVRVRICHNDPDRFSLLTAGLERTLASLVALESVLNPLPVDKVPPSSNILRTAVLAINVISMLPNIDDKKSLTLALDNRVGAIMAALNAELAVLTKNQEDPTTAKVAHSSSGESLLELIKVTETGIDLLLEVLAHFMGSLVLSSSHAKPIEVMVEELTSLIAHGTSRSSLHDSANRLVLELSRSTSEFSELGCIALMMLLIMELNSLSRDVRLKSILSIREFNSSVSGHCLLGSCGSFAVKKNVTPNNQK